MLLLVCRLKYEIISLIRGRRLLVHSEGVGREFTLTDNIESGTELIIIITRAAAEEEQPASQPAGTTLDKQRRHSLCALAGESTSP